MFSKWPLREDPRNHCVPILDLFEDEDDPSHSYMVMPYLRCIDDPPFEMCQDKELPELSAEDPYDPFKVNIFILGIVFRRELYDKYSNVGFLVPLITAMIPAHPALRPDAAEALAPKQIRGSIWNVHKFWRLRERQHPFLMNHLLDAASLAWRP
ncbi:uncharacterized protein FIBRA_01196 [Fibroporia radiculosa]|uniref:Protein kinase domain-containing protein n=1 Tax=Fibroporia radiculosa TaxID=599839 RepID=J4I8C7_9APHY|nr:uncharacterized protein FIBRA_01196 [Fibroporia radiculosa]CCL99181.1 predicted protein [Fibroporia radiculosa]